MNKPSDREYVEALCKNYNRIELHAMALAFSTATEVATLMYEQISQDDVLDTFINETLEDPNKPANVGNEMEDPIFKLGLKSGIALLCGALEREFKSSESLLKEAFQEKISNG